MKNTNYTVQVIEPNEGYTLTQSKDVDVTERILSKKVFLAVNDSPENWKEITDAEADEIKKQKEELAEQRKKEAEQRKKEAEK